MFFVWCRNEPKLFPRVSDQSCLDAALRSLYTHHWIDVLQQQMKLAHQETGKPFKIERAVICRASATWNTLQYSDHIEKLSEPNPEPVTVKSSLYQPNGKGSVIATISSSRPSSLHSRRQQRPHPLHLPDDQCPFLAWSTSQLRLEKLIKPWLRSVLMFDQDWSWFPEVSMWGTSLTQMTTNYR